MRISSFHELFQSEVAWPNGEEFRRRLFTFVHFASIFVRDRSAFFASSFWGDKKCVYTHCQLFSVLWRNCQLKLRIKNSWFWSLRPDLYEDWLPVLAKLLERPESCKYLNTFAFQSWEHLYRICNPGTEDHIKLIWYWSWYWKYRWVYWNCKKYSTNFWRY